MHYATLLFSHSLPNVLNGSETFVHASTDIPLLGPCHTEWHTGVFCKLFWELTNGNELNLMTAEIFITGTVPCQSV